MNINEQHLWNAISDAIHKHSVNASGFIIDFVENPECKGFTIQTDDGKLTVQALGCILTDEIESNGWESYVEPPGTFEGMKLHPDIEKF